MGDLPPIQGAEVVRGIFGDRALPTDAHAGLVFDRYLRIWAGGVDAPDKSADVRSDLQRFVQQYNERAGRPGEHASLLSQQHARLDRTDESVAQRVYTTSFRLTTGLGQAHPLENGFVFDPVLGVPFLPGSSVKGLLRAHLKLTGAPSDRVRRLLGNEPPRAGGEPEKPQTGSLVVLPALPKEWPRLAVDVVNCHHPAYYGSNGKADPVDWENPNPVYFLAVDTGVEFVFRLALRPGASGAGGGEIGRTDLAWAFDALGEALDVLGIGAKTAVGYGVMAPPGGRAMSRTHNDAPAGPEARSTEPTGSPRTPAPTTSSLGPDAIGALLRSVDKNNASAKVPGVLEAVPDPQRPAVAREIVKKLDRKWVEARKDKSWAADLLAMASKS